MSIAFRSPFAKSVRHYWCLLHAASVSLSNSSRLGSVLGLLDILTPFIRSMLIHYLDESVDIDGMSVQNCIWSK